ncbi:hypothetical protein DFH08DRAFT_681522 [Mycena albidolilacea]|uniref:Tyr recombinase domain-containing protein n=1 Tax=Mycena albidolilacea TaxID=1033008 RepID=A0AAD7APS8_9AGAR|nr:hypothetical protein DFH08DRAFT_681522 [Mycena albidolilacea]
MRTSRRGIHGVPLKADAKAKIQHALEHAWADSTIEKYGQSLEAYQQFCDAQEVPAPHRLPASEELLCAFAAARVGEIAGGTARSAVAAVKAWHIIHDAPWKGGLRLRYTLKGVEKLAPSSSAREERPPVTKEMLNLLERDLDLSSPEDAAVFAAACGAFWGQIRLGEILSDTQGTYFEGRIPLGADFGQPATPAGTRVLRLPWTKTKGAKGDSAILCRQNSATDPVNAIANHVNVNSIPPDQPLFSFRNDKGYLVCLSRRKFLKRCNEVWKKRGIPSFTGHSFRIGGTTHLLIAGVNPDVVQAMGRWNSDAFLIYWRRLDILAPLHAEFLVL